MRWGEQSLEEALSRGAEEAGRLPEQEIVFIATTGDHIPVSLSRSVVKDRKGNLRGVVCVGRDITAQKQTEAEIISRNEALNKANKLLEREIEERLRAEEALREREAQYKGVFDSASDAFIIFDEVGNIVEANPQAVAMSGYTHEELLTMKGMDLLHPDSLSLMEEEKKKIPTRKHLSMELIDKRKDGTPFYVEVKGGEFLYRGSPHGLAVVRDISDRKKMEDQLRGKERQYRNIFDSVTDGLILCDMSGSVIDANPQACCMHGYSRDELVRLSLGHLIRADYHNVVKTIYAYAVRDEIFQEEVIAVRKDGGFFEVDMRGKAFDEMGMRRLLVIMRDLTEKLRLEHQLQQAQKMEAIGRLAGGVAHDFNNILTAIIGYSELLKEDLPHDDDSREHVQEVLQAGSRAKEVVGQILAFSRQEENVRMPLDIHLIVKEALKLVRSTLPTSIEIRTNIAPCGTVLGNATQIHQIIMNLCTNSYHAMNSNKGGILEVSLVAEDEAGSAPEEDQAGDNSICLGERNCSDSSPNKYVILSVKDTGHGMSKDVLERIFDPYFTTKQKEQGVGLGLSVVHGIVRHHGGRIRVESEPGHGTSFHIYLPRSGCAAASSKPILYEPVPTGTGRILFVDDEPPITEMAKKILERLGYQVTARNNSKESLHLFKLEPEGFDLVITDMTMPDMTGDTLAVELMKIRPDLPVVLCTGFSEQIDEERALAMGLRAFLLKPLTRRNLGETVRDVLNSH